jgi:hypothetical protein
MDEPRLSASPQGAVSGTDEQAVAPEGTSGGAVVERVDRRGMLPRLHGVEFKPEDEELLLLLAEQFYPDLTHIDQIENWQEKRGWLILCTQILKGQEATIRYAAETFSKVFQPGVDAQVADSLRKGAAEELERQERKAREIEIFKANLILLAQKGVLTREEWDLEKTERLTRLILETEAKQQELAAKRQEAEEKEIWARHRERREKMVMGFATIIFACAFVAFIIGLLSQEPWIIGTSGATGIGALVAAVTLLSNENNPPPPPAPPASGGAPHEARSS